MSKKATVPDRIPAAEIDNRIKEAVSTHLSNEEFRKRVIAIFDDCTGTVTFMDKVKDYASKEINDRIFKNGFAIIVWLVSLTIAGVVGSYVTKMIH